MRTIFWRVITCCLLLLIQQGADAQKKEKSGIKKIRVLPVYLVYTGLPVDTTLDRLVKEAFTRHSVKVLTYSQFDQMSKREVDRVAAKFRTRSNTFQSEREIREAIGREQQFVSNMLEINFTIQRSGDSIRITGASWDATPFPPNLSDPRSSGTIETVLADTCCSPMDNIFAVIDKILMSKWLR